MTITHTRFDRLDGLGRIDLTSGAWDHDTNRRAAHCGRCDEVIPAGYGRPYNEFMSDCYRATTRYLCGHCRAEIGEGQATEGAEDDG